MSRYALLGESGARAQTANVELLASMTGVTFIKNNFQDELQRVHGCDAVVHAAAQVCHSRKGAADSPFDDLHTNILGTAHLLEAVRLANVPLLFIGSSKVYGERIDHWPQPTDETCPFGDQTHLTFFGASKAAADLLCQMYSRKYGMPVGVLRPGCFTGPTALAAEAQNWLPWLVHCAKAGVTFNLFGDGHQVRDLLHARDLARACTYWLERPRSGVWNIGGGPRNSESLLRSIERVERLMSTTVKIERHPTRAGDIRTLVLNNARFRRDYDWLPRHVLSDIFEEACDE